MLPIVAMRTPRSAARRRSTATWISGFDTLSEIFGSARLGIFCAAASAFSEYCWLGLLYILRSLIFAVYFVMPPTPTSTLLFAAAMGMLWWPGLAPLIGGLVAEIFGTRYMATLLGVSFVVHQAGSSLGAWGGGLIFDLTGSYDDAWQIGTLIGFAAGVVQIVAGGPTPAAGSSDRACGRDDLGLRRRHVRVGPRKRTHRNKRDEI